VTHLLTGLCVAACRQKRRVRFATAAALVNELVVETGTDSYRFRRTMEKSRSKKAG
jgi:DNA replication protein DnaC